MDQIRNGLFTSSNAYRLMGTAKVAETYIQEKNWERKSGLPISTELSTHALSWGRAMEGYVYENHLEIEYELSSQKTTVHPSGLWCGTKDVLKPNVVGDIKCPHSRGEFFKLSDMLLRKSVEIFKEECPKYYWQLVSNAILETTQYAESIIWMPYESEFEAILSYIEGLDDFQMQLDIQWVAHTDISRLPHIKEGFDYENVCRFKFEVPHADKILLETNIKNASKKLIQWKPQQN